MENEELEMNIIGKKPKEKLIDCLNDCDMDILKNIYKEYSNKKINKKEDYIKYLEKEIINKFKKYLKSCFSFKIYIALKNIDKSGEINYIDELINNGFMFHYHSENPDKECINIIPIEIKEIFKKEFTKKIEEEYLFQKTRQVLTNYLLISGFIPKNELKKIILNNKFLNANEEIFNKAIEEENIRSYKEYYSILPGELVDKFLEDKVVTSYKEMSIIALEKYVEMYNKLVDDILLLLGIKNREDNPIAIIDIVMHLTSNYNDLNEIAEYLKDEYNLTDEVKQEIEDLIQSKKSYLRFWNIGGKTNEEYQSSVWLENGILDKIPTNHSIKECLKNLPLEGLNLIKTFFYLKDSDNIERVYKEQLKYIKEDLEESYEHDYLFYLSDMNGKEYSSFIFSDLLFSGFIFLYKEDGKIKILIPTETQEIIDNLNKKSIDTGIKDYLINRYLKLNGIISIEKLEEILNKEYSINISKKEIIYNLKEHGVDIVDNKYACFVSGFPKQEREQLLMLKDAYKQYRIIDVLEEDVEEEFLQEFDDYLLKFDYDEKNIIKSYVFTPLFYGIYNKEEMKEMLSNKNLGKYANEIDNIVKKYKNRIGIWPLNGFTINQRIIKSNKVGRNDPCPCGSGLKYKKCCGK